MQELNILADIDPQFQTIQARAEGALALHLAEPHTGITADQDRIIRLFREIVPDLMTLKLVISLSMNMCWAVSLMRISELRSGSFKCSDRPDGLINGRSLRVLRWTNRFSPRHF